jgi:signal transduction histidine kinase
MAQTLHVLLIDDNRSDRILVIRELRREFAPLEVIEIIDAEEFEQALVKGRFDVVITDYQLGWSTGLEVLRAVKARYPQCPVIMFTNTGTEEVAVEALQSGLDDYVLKAAGRYVRLPASIRLALQRQQQEQQAALLEIRLRELLARLRVGVFRAQPDHGLIESNPAFLEILGVSSLDQAKARNLLDLDDCYRLHSRLPPSQPLEREIQIHRPDGTLLWGLLTTTLNTVAGQTVVDGLLEDITERKHAESLLQQLNTSLEERVRERTAELEELTARLRIVNRDLEEFTFTASHDLRAPLRTIEGLARLLLADEPLSLDGLEYTQRIISGARRADTLITELLDYGRLGADYVTVEPTSIAQVLADILVNIPALTGERNTQIQVEQPLPEVIANAVILDQILTNLITNAVKFVSPGTQPKVRIWAEPQGATVRLWIEDNGIGIEETYRQEIFKPFNRLHSHEEYVGSGIGLAIVRKGIEILGGKVGVESTKDEGSRFWIELPVVQEG